MTSPGNLFQCLTGHIITQGFLMFNLNFLCSCLTQYFLSYPHWIRRTTYSFPLLSALFIGSPPQTFLQTILRAFLPVLLVACVCWASGCSQCSLLDLFCLVSSLKLKGLATKCLHCSSCEKLCCILSKHPQNGLVSPVQRFSPLLYAETKLWSNIQDWSRSISQEQIQGRCL